MKRLMTAFGLLVFVTLSAPVRAEKLHILVDGSGSMRGFFKTSGVQDLVQQIERGAFKAGFDPKSSVFVSNRGDEAPRFDPLDAWLSRPEGKRYGDTTRLDALLNGVPKQQAIVIITDNFQDDSGEGIGRTQVFYRQLQEAALTRVYTAPILRDFDGHVAVGVGRGIPAGRKNAKRLLKTIKSSTQDVFLGPKGRIGQPIWRTPTGQQGYWRIPYRGRRGLVVYFLLTESPPKLDERFVNLVKAFGVQSETTPFLIRPLGIDSVRLKPSKSGQPAPKALACSGLKLEDLPSPNLTLRAEGGGRYSIGLDEDHALSYDPREPGQFVAAFEVVSTKAHIQLRPGQTCETSAKVVASPLRVTAKREGVLLPGVQGQARTHPAYLVAPLAEEAEGPRAVFLVIDLPPLVGPDVPQEAFAGQLVVELDLEIHVPPTAWRTAPEVQNRYFTPNPLDLARVYSPKDLVQVLAPPTIKLNLPVSVQSEVISQPPRPVTPAEFPWWIVWFIVSAVVVFIIWRKILPLGFSAPLRVNERRGRSVSVGGSLRPQEGRIAIDDTRHLRVTRTKRYGRALTFWLDGEHVGQNIEPGRRFDLPNQDVQLRYLTGEERRRLAQEGRYDEH